VSDTPDYGVGINIPDDPRILEGDKLLDAAADLSLMRQLDERMRSHRMADLERRRELIPKLKSLEAAIADIQEFAGSLRKEEFVKWNKNLDEACAGLGIGDEEQGMIEPDDTTGDLWYGLDVISYNQSLIEDVQIYCKLLANILTK
jgi:hypothetical protein